MREVPSSIPGQALIFHSIRSFFEFEFSENSSHLNAIKGFIQAKGIHHEFCIYSTSDTLNFKPHLMQGMIIYYLKFQFKNVVNKPHCFGISKRLIRCSLYLLNFVHSYFIKNIRLVSW